MKNENINNIRNIPLECFRSIMLPNVQDESIVNIYLFYREEKISQSNEFKDFLKQLDLKKMILKLFEVSENEEFILKTQEEIVNFDFNLFNEEEKNDMKWLLYDCKNPSGNKIVKGNNFKCDSGLYIYFTDRKIMEKLEEEQMAKLSFYENERKTKKYLKVHTKQNSYDKFHYYVMFDGNKEKIINAEKENKIVDHMQMPPKYFYDINCWSNKNQARIDFANGRIDNKNKIKNIIYSSIIECWKDRIEWKFMPQQNDCYYNLLLLDKNVNKNEKYKLVEERNEDKNGNKKDYTIFPHRSIEKKDVFYITIYFYKTQELKVNNEIKKIVSLTIRYKARTNINDDYEKVIKKLYEIIGKKEIKNSVKKLNELYKYIQGKYILYMVEDNNNINQRAIIENRAFFNMKEEEMAKYAKMEENFHSN